MHDLVIRNGTIVDGSGKPRFVADVAVDGGLITAIGPDIGKGREEIDAARQDRRARLGRHSHAL